jgi:hypothetical protein
MVATVPSESEETLCMLNLSKSYGYEVRNASWRAQFVGKSAPSPLQSNGDIWNVGGATLTDGSSASKGKRIRLSAP